MPVAVPRRLGAPIALTLMAATLPVLVGSAASAAPVAAAPVAAPAAAASKAATPLTTPLTSFTLRRDGERRVNVAPRSYVAARVSLPTVRAALAGAPTTAQVDAGAAPVAISLPAPDGTLVEFAVAEDSVMEPALQAAHPELRTYAGRGITDPTDTIRFDVTPLGLHAAVRSVVGARSWYVDPAYYGRGVTSHLSYTRASVPAADLGFVERPVQGVRAALAKRRSVVTAARRAGEVVVQRTYRMAFVTTPSYADDFGTANVLAEKVRVINRTNEIYMDDMAIKFVLVDGTEKLNLDTLAKATGADGPCGADPCFTADEIESCGGTLNDINFVTGSIIGADNYDIGHLGSGAGSGGVARLAAVGGEFKSSGCTALDEPRGDFYAIDFFAHEVGHQMAGNHTFDGISGSCMATNRNAPTSVEPGSGSTVMAYAGICFNDDLQKHTDPFFSQLTIDEFTANATAAPTALTEVQQIRLSLFSGTDSFKLGYGSATPVTITNGTNYTAAGIQAALLTLTGKTGFTIEGYHGAASLGATGFTVTWPDTTDADSLTVTDFVGASGAATTMVEGGPTGNQGAMTTLTNHRPTVDAGLDKTIPISTPFQLTAAGADVDADQTAGLTYLWEQNDVGIPGDPILGVGLGTSLASPVKLIGPLFRVFGTVADVSDEQALLYHSAGQNLADGTPSRSFPDLAQVVAGNTNAEGPCPVPTTDPTAGMEGDALDCLSEFLPDAPYAAASGELNFRVTARDGDPTGGGTGHDDVTLTLDPSAGPFLVSSRDTAGDPATAGADETVTWDVAGTGSATFATTVKITVSTDGGLTFPYVGLEETENDGSAIIKLPSVNTTKARIKVEAVGNYFYDVNGADFTIEGATAPPAPDTLITGGLKRRGFLVGYRTTYPFESSIADSTFECRLDGTVIPCDSTTGTTLRNLKPGTHRFLVTATSPDGVVDPTPAKREFTVVANERAMTKSSGWRNVKDERFYRSTYFTTSTKGATLSIKYSRLTRWAVLVAKGKGFGRIEVLLDGKRIRTINTGAGQAQLGALFASGNLQPARTGTLTIRTLDSKPVIIDGVGIRVQLP